MAWSAVAKTKNAQKRLEIADRYVKGETQAQIGEAMGLNFRTISHHLKTIRDAWEKEAVLDIDKAKGKELAKLNKLELEYWSAWERSKKQKEKTLSRSKVTGKTRKSKKTEGEDDTGKEQTESATSKEQRDGNPAFLQGILNCIDRRCKLLGLDAPLRLDLKAEAARIAQEFGLQATDATLLIAEAEAIIRGRG